MRQDWEERLADFKGLGIETGKAKTDLVYIEERRDALLGELMDNFDGSVEHRKMKAKNHDSYVAWLRDRMVAMEKYETLKARLEAARIWFDMLRTEEASRRNTK